MENTFKVPKGCLVVPKDDGSGYLPFLVNVREEDIIWSKKNKKIESVIDKFLFETGGELYTINPGTSYKMEKDGWSCEICTDGSVVATKTMKIDDSFVFKDESHYCLRAQGISLPVLFLYDREFNIQATKCSYNDQLTMSTINTPLAGTTSWTYTGDDGKSKTFSGYRSMIMEIYSPIYKFPETFIKDMTGSYIFITVKGYIPTV